MVPMAGKAHPEVPVEQWVASLGLEGKVDLGFQTLADLARGGSWSPLGVIILAPGGGGIQRVSASGGAATPLSAGRLPWFLPDGRHFVYELLIRRTITRAKLQLPSRVIKGEEKDS